MKDQLDALLNKDMDRRNFLKHVAFGFATLTGVAGLLKTLTNMDRQQPATSSQFGYGGGSYGGGSSRDLRS